MKNKFIKTIAIVLSAFIVISSIPVYAENTKIAFEETDVYEDNSGTHDSDKGSSTETEAEEDSFSDPDDYGFSDGSDNPISTIASYTDVAEITGVSVKLKKNTFRAYTDYKVVSIVLCKHNHFFAKH